jgi:hypothetical protein
MIEAIVAHLNFYFIQATRPVAYTHPVLRLAPGSAVLRSSAHSVAPDAKNALVVLSGRSTKVGSS